MVMQGDNRAAVESYLDHLLAQGRSSSTVRTYRRALEPFLRWLGDMDLAAVSAADLERYCRHLRGRGVQMRSVVEYLRTIRAFFRWQGRSDLGAVSYSEPAPTDSLSAALTDLLGGWLPPSVSGERLQQVVADCLGLITAALAEAQAHREGGIG
jgi:site-specific recombinase XerD